MIGLTGGISLTDNSPFGWRKLWHIVTALNGFSHIVTFVLCQAWKPLLQCPPFWGKVLRLDWTAFSLLGAGLVFFRVGPSYANWSDSHVIALLVIDAVFFIALVLHRTFIQKHGLIDHDFFKRDRNCALARECFFMDGVFLFSANGYFPFQIEVL